MHDNDTGAFSWKQLLGAADPRALAGRKSEEIDRLQGLKKITCPQFLAEWYPKYPEDFSLQLAGSILRSPYNLSPQISEGRNHVLLGEEVDSPAGRTKPD